MKRILSLFLCLLLTAALTVPAMADVLWIPDDDFYNEHMEECLYSNEVYEAETDTPICYSPQNGTTAGVISAGETVLVSYVWTDVRGDEWGYVEYAEDGSWTQGWIDMTNPTAGPAPNLVTLPIILIVCVLALASACILLIGRKKR